MGKWWGAKLGQTLCGHIISFRQSEDDELCCETDASPCCRVYLGRLPVIIRFVSAVSGIMILVDENLWGGTCMLSCDWEVKLIVWKPADRSMVAALLQDCESSLRTHQTSMGTKSCW